MPAFLVILLVVVLVNWLGWWLLAIVGGLFVAVGTWVYLDTRQSASTQTTVSSDLYRRDRGDAPAQPPRTIRIEIKSVSFGQSQPTTSTRRVGLSLSNGLRPSVALVVKDEPLERILSGQKLWEMRTQHTRKRETVALAKKGTGQIFGLADIVDSRGPLSDATMVASVRMHGIDISRLLKVETAKYRYAWVLANVRRLPSPIPYSHTKGAQSFVLLDESTSRALIAATSGD